MNRVPDLVKLLERRLHEAINELTVCQYAILSYVGDELRVAANEAELERQELEARVAELEAENAALKEYRDGHDPKVDFPPEGVWVNMRDCDDNFSPMQYDHNIGWYWNYAVNYDGDSFSYWYPDDTDLVRWYPIPPLPEPPEVKE